MKNIELLILIDNVLSYIVSLDILAGLGWKHSKIYFKTPQEFDLIALTKFPTLKFARIGAFIGIFENARALARMLLL